MTIAVCLKIHDGVVLASDSAVTLSVGTSIMNVYNNGNKIFNLHKGLPIGAVFWGSGNIGPASMATLAKDLRRRLTEGYVEEGGREWKLNREEFSIKDVADKARRFLFEETYKKAYPDGNSGFSMQLVVTGYSSKSELPETYAILIDKDTCDEPILVQGTELTGIYWGGELEPIQRLLAGFSNLMPQFLVNIGVKQEDLPAVVEKMKEDLSFQLHAPAMPIQDAIDLATYLAETTVGFVRFAPGHKTVGGPIEVAAITRHEGFKWVKRKHFFKSELNNTAAV